MKKKFIAFVMATVLSVGILSGCGKEKSSNTNGSNRDNAPAADELNTARTIRLGDQASYFTSKVALKKGFLAEEFGDEYEFTLSSFTNGPAATEAFVAGEIDIALYGDVPAVQAFANGTDIRIISSLWTSENAYAVLAGPNSGIDTIEDLKGKNLGFTAGTNGHIFILKVLEKAGLKESDVTLVNVSGADSVPALISGDVDTIIISQPKFDLNIEQTGGKIITTNAETNLAAVFVLADNGFASKNPEIVQRILKVYDKTNAWIAENPEEATKIVAEYNGTDEESNKKYYETHDWVIGWSQDLTDTIKSTIEFSYNQGNIISKFDASELIDTSYLEAAGLYSK